MKSGIFFFFLNFYLRGSQKQKKVALDHVGIKDTKATWCEGEMRAKRRRKSKLNDEASLTGSSRWQRRPDGILDGVLDGVLMVTEIGAKREGETRV